MNEEEIKQAIQNIIEHCRALTLRLVRLKKGTNQVEGVASGFLFKEGDSVFLISAGHALNKERWAIETDLTDDEKHRTACIPIGGAWLIKKAVIGDSELEDIDVGWARIDLKSFGESVKGEEGLKGKKFEYVVYEGPLVEEPNAEEPHAYAAMNQVSLFDALGRAYLERDISYEYEMKFTGTRDTDGLYVFSIPKHKGHNYYRGASGSPIVDSSGVIKGILVKGCERKNELYAYPMKGLLNLIRIGKEVDQASGGCA